MSINIFIINNLRNMYDDGHHLANRAIRGQLCPALARDTAPGTPDNSEEDKTGKNFSKSMPHSPDEI